MSDENVNEEIEMEENVSHEAEPEMEEDSNKAKAEADHRKAMDEKNAKVSIGTKETKEALRLVFAGIKTVKQAKEGDGVIDKGDILKLANMYPYIGPAFDDADKIMSELKDLSHDEVKDLIVFTGVNIGDIIDEDKQMEILEASVKVAISIVELIKLIAEKH